MRMIDIHTHSPLVILAVWAGILFGLGVGIGAALGWIFKRRF